MRIRQILDLLDGYRKNAHQGGGRLANLKRFLFLYANLFSLIWIGYGTYAVVADQPNGQFLLGFGVAFAIVIFAASWFSYWLMGHYKRIDQMAKHVFSSSRKQR
ncbi:hypothetical protein [Thermoactinomyces mirandus]|uniref:Uncharacterized protein n=1 Tax=Thermoactinomyces mirandus TaxID=2756294 RepID=A0A7W1XTZ3_9BACL|nr:hypothetical protein [Thermoactinomyces mirandus]MBA4603239.1 hypothetical protein [Thermoactinomyces mirandus]